MNREIYITGHKNPDTDSIVSAIAYAKLKQKRNGLNAIPVRLGEINSETQFVLDYFKVEKPRYMDTIKPRVGDLDMDPAFYASPEISLAKAIRLIQSNHNNNIAVVDDSNNLVGVVSLSNITACYLDVWDDAIIKNSNTPLENIVETLSGELLYTPEVIRPFGFMHVYAMTPQKAEEFISEGDIVIVGDRSDAQLDAINRNVSVLILTGGCEIEPSILSEAEKRNIVVLRTNFNSFMAARLLPQSVPISYVMTTENIVTFDLDDFVEDVQKIMGETRYRSYPVIDETGHVAGNISRFHLISNPQKELILVDHNEKNQSIPGIDYARITEIIDHHRIANITTGHPVFFRNETVGSTSTIIAKMYIEQGIRPEQSIAGILSAAIISDTLMLRSPTATELDRQMLERMSKIAGIDIDTFAKDMFKAGTSLEEKEPVDLLRGDVKEFIISGKRVRIAQVMTMDLDSLEGIRLALIEKMTELRLAGGEDDFVLVLTDILKETSKFIVVGPDAESIARSFDAELVDSTFLAPGVLSRKKQVVPKITQALEK